MTIAAERFYRDNDRLLEGGIWAEVTLAYNEVDEDDFTFYIEDMRPIQLSRFNFEGYQEGRSAFTRDEWLDSVLRAVGLEPSKLSHRLKLHFIARLTPLVEPNLNFIELGQRGTGKSYFFSEFSPYATLVSGGQASKATLFYNNARRRIGLVGFWDTVAFDEVAGNPGFPAVYAKICEEKLGQSVPQLRAIEWVMYSAGNPLRQGSVDATAGTTIKDA